MSFGAYACKGTVRAASIRNNISITNKIDIFRMIKPSICCYLILICILNACIIKSLIYPIINI